LIGDTEVFNAYEQGFGSLEGGNQTGPAFLAGLFYRFHALSPAEQSQHRHFRMMGTPKNDKIRRMKRAGIFLKSSFRSPIQKGRGPVKRYS
jgi:hypothetical protein